MSATTFAFYAWDKRAARLDRRRVPERTLHLLELLGGWPGGLLGMRLLHHKRQKTAYRVVFWIIVAAHLSAWGWWIASG